MNLLVTGAWQASPEELDELRGLGHTVLFQPQEKEPLAFPPEEIDGVICNGLFLYHPIESFTRLRYIQLTSAGYDRIPMDYVKARNIEIHNARGVYSVPMAEHALTGVLALYRRLPVFFRQQQDRFWNKIRNLEELTGKSVLIVGCGNIGTECAGRFAALGCEIHGIDLVARPPESPFASLEDAGRLNGRLKGADILILTLPLTAETRNFMDAARLALLKDHAIVVNISRGAIIHQKTLESELKSGRLRAVLDVFEDEPLETASPLWGLDNIVLTPHNSFAGEGNGRRLSTLVLNNLERRG